jgi:hypothetical protein
MKQLRWSAVTGVLTLALATSSWAATTVIHSPPVRESEPHRQVTFFVGGVDEAGHSMKVSDIDLLVDGERVGAPASSQTFSDWSTVSGEASQTWKPPLSIGLVYLWIDGVPAGVLDGVQAFCQRIPPRTVVFPTIYGRLRQGRARMPASESGRLQELSHLEADRPNLIEAVRLDLTDLAADEAPLKILLVVTDGRDYADPKGEGPGDFADLGRAIREAGITPFIVAFPSADADVDAVAKNLHDLHDAAGGFLRVLEKADDLENTLESLGQSLADLQRVTVVEPWSWSMMGGTHRIGARLTVGGQHLTTEIGTVAAGGGAGRIVLFVVVALGGVVVLLGLVMFFSRRGASRSSSDDEDAEAGDEETIVSAAHDLIRRGASPQRAVEELSRVHGSAISAIVDLDAEVLSDPRFRYFQTRAGRARLKDIQDILSKKAVARAALGGTLAGILAAAIKDQTPAEQAAKLLAARVAPEEATEFAAMPLDKLAEALRGASGGAQAVLGTPRARGIAVSIQDALRAGRLAGRGVSVGWLVRAGGPGRRGETLHLDPARSVLGHAPSASLRIDGDGQLASEHAEIVVEDGVFFVAPLEGTVKVEGTPTMDRRQLTDGETLQVGAGVYVFKSASSGQMGTSTRPTGAPRRVRA